MQLARPFFNLLNGFSFLIHTASIHMNLIIQSLNAISPLKLKPLVSLTRAVGIEPITDRAYRLLKASPHDAVASYCREQQFDYGYVRPKQKITDFGLVAMDMDSTLINIECIDELADLTNQKLQVAAITEAAMHGEIDFAESLRRRVALLEGLPESALQQVYDERLQLSPGTEILLQRLQQLGIKTLLVSGGFEFFTERLQQRLKLDFTQANKLEIVDGKLTGKVQGSIFDAQGKADYLVHTRKHLGLKSDQVIVLGDGANDIKMMRQAAVSIAYHAKPIVLTQASYAFNFVGLDGVLALFGE